MNTPITRELAAKVLQTVDAGLSYGAGAPIPGEMCVEAAVCYAMGLPHGDDPPCVSRALRKLKIRLNDSRWSSRETRARGMRRLAIVQLGTRDVLDDQEFACRVALLVVNRLVPQALRRLAGELFPVLSSVDLSVLETTASACEAATGSVDAAANAAGQAASVAVRYFSQVEASRTAHVADMAKRAAWKADLMDAEAAAEAAATAVSFFVKNDEQLATFAEDVVQILIDMGAPGAEFLDLTETP